MTEAGRLFERELRWHNARVPRRVHMQRGHGLGSILDRSLRSAWPLFTQMPRHFENTWESWVLRTGLQIAKDVAAEF